MRPRDRLLLWKWMGRSFFLMKRRRSLQKALMNSLEEVPRQRPKKKRGKREEDLKGLPVIVVEHSMEEKELEQRFGQGRMEAVAR